MQPTPPSVIRRFATPLVALAIVAFCFGMAQFPKLAPGDAAQLAAPFKFERHPLAEVANHPPYASVSDVHPSLKRIAAWISTLGSGVTLADIDGDGLANDLINSDPRTRLVTVAPAPGTGDRYAPFALDAAPLPFNAKTTAPMGILAGDFNEDGRMDLMVYYWGRTPVIFLQQPAAANATKLTRASFTATELTTNGERWFSNGAITADLDGDGHPDILVGNYFQDGAQILDASAGGVEVMQQGLAKALAGGKKHFFLWDGVTAGANPTVRFREVTNIVSPEVEHGWTLAIGTADLDGDQMPEVYLGNDFGPDRLLHNESTPGHLKFTVLEGRRDFATPKSCALGFDSFKGMGVDFGDVNGDGLLDIYVSNIADRFALTESHFLWQSTGALDDMKHGVAPYVQASESLGLSRSGWGWDCRLADFDNSGRVQAIQAVGFIKGGINRWPELQSLGTSNSRIVHDPRLWPSFKPGADLSGDNVNPFFVRAADGRFYNVGPEVGLTEPMVTRAIALADVDGDGRLDFAFGNQWQTSYFYRNVSPNPGAFLGLHLLQPLADEADTPLRERPGHPGADMRGRSAFGAQALVVLSDGRKLVGQVDGGSGHSGRRSQDIHLGLGKLDAKAPLDVALKWRDIHGQFQQTTLKLTPGWHTVLLGDPNPRVAAGVRQPLTLTLSPSDGEREIAVPSQVKAFSNDHDSTSEISSLSPSDGERAGVRGGPDSIVPTSSRLAAANDGGAR